MSPNSLGLQKGDVVEISYPPKHAVASPQPHCRRWLRAQVIDSTPDAWPLVRVSDGQTTEIRRFMPWRLVARAEPTCIDLANQQRNTMPSATGAQVPLDQSDDIGGALVSDHVLGFRDDLSTCPADRAGKLVGVDRRHKAVLGAE